MSWKTTRGPGDLLVQWLLTSYITSLRSPRKEMTEARSECKSHPPHSNEVQRLDPGTKLLKSKLQLHRLLLVIMGELLTLLGPVSTAK